MGPYEDILDSSRFDDRKNNSISEAAIMTSKDDELLEFVNDDDTFYEFSDLSDMTFHWARSLEKCNH